MCEYSINDISSRKHHSACLLIKPTKFAVSYEINPHMGGSVDKSKALEQWETLVEAYEKLTSVRTINPVNMFNSTDELKNPETLPDIVFCANHGLPYREQRQFILSNMRYDERKPEVKYTEKYFNDDGWQIITPPEDIAFEGMGDAIWHPGKNLIWMGYGFRTDKEVAEFISETLDVKVAPLELTSEEYYHLDTCFSPITEDTVAIVREGLSSEALNTVYETWETVLEIPESEGRELACNLHSPDGKNVLFPDENPSTNNILSDHGFTPVPIDTSEFEKAGGSVFCMKLEY